MEVQQKKNATNSIVLPLASKLFEASAFASKHPEICRSKEVDKISRLNDVKAYIMLMDKYLSAGIEAKKFQNEECQHVNVKIIFEQTRCIDEMETLTRVCTDCGDVSMKS